MRILADQNVDAAIVQWLRLAGHGVFWASEMAVSAPDPELISIARRESRILITGDLDFGELVYRHGRVATGVVLLRYRTASQHDRLRLLQAQWPLIEARVPGHFIVCRNNRVRIRPISPAGS